MLLISMEGRRMQMMKRERKRLRDIRSINQKRKMRRKKKRNSRKLIRHLENLVLVRLKKVK